MGLFESESQPSIWTSAKPLLLEDYQPVSELSHLLLLTVLHTVHAVSSKTRCHMTKHMVVIKLWNNLGVNTVTEVEMRINMQMHNMNLTTSELSIYIHALLIEVHVWPPKLIWLALIQGWCDIPIASFSIINVKGFFAFHVLIENVELPDFLIVALVLSLQACLYMCVSVCLWVLRAS